MKAFAFTTVSAAAVVALALLSPSASHAVETAPPEIKLTKTDAGWTLADTRGMAIYIYDQDRSDPGKSTCNGPKVDSKTGQKAAGGGCEAEWPAVKASDKAKPFGDWTIITRHDGVKQWAFQGRPLYTYAEDAYAGATFGENDFWHVAFKPVETPPEIKISKTVLGRVLTDLRGMTLYTRDGETASGKPVCAGVCTDTWAPLVAPWVAQTHGNWSVLVREGGLRQWAFQGRPLYTYVGDLAVGSTNGDGMDTIWRAAVVESAPQLPSWVTVQKSDMGRVLADSNGRTLYGFVGDLKKVNIKSCNDDCMRQYWRPVPASADAKSGANFSIETAPDGTKLWSYKGSMLYTFTQDEKPGHIRGDRFASGDGVKMATGGWWRPLLEKCMCVAPKEVP
jgi:predicted lipoprotein with Yx(FWY)xxD motif